MNKKQMNTGLVVFICCVLVAVGVTLHLRKHDMLPIIHKVVDNTTATLVADTVKTKKPVVKRDFNISGSLKDTEGNGVAGVIVSDGFKCVKTDSRGRYKMKRDSLARFIYFPCLLSSRFLPIRLPTARLVFTRLFPTRKRFMTLP